MSRIKDWEKDSHRVRILRRVGDFAPFVYSLFTYIHEILLYTRAARGDRPIQRLFLRVHSA